MTTKFADASRLTAADIEEGTAFAPRFDAAGLVSAIAVEEQSGDVLMLAHMNEAALRLTLETGDVHYYSRSRHKIWKKGETSGEVQKLVEMRVDCDQDAILLIVRQTGIGASCHTGRKSCFYRTVVAESDTAKLAPTGGAPLFDPHSVYKS